MESNDTMIDAIDTTNTPDVPFRIGATDFDTEEVLGLIVADWVKEVDADSLVSWLPAINRTVMCLPEVYRCE